MGTKNSLNEGNGSKNVSMNEGIDAKMCIVYALWDLKGIATIDEIIERLRTLGHPLSKPHLVRLSKELENRNIVIRLRVKELKEEVMNYINALEGEHKRMLLKRMNEIVENNNSRALVMILNLAHEETIRLVKIARERVKKIEERKLVVRQAIENLAKLIEPNTSNPQYG